MIVALLVGLGQHTKHWHTFCICNLPLLSHREKEPPGPPLTIMGITATQQFNHILRNEKQTSLQLTFHVYRQTAMANSVFLTLAYRALFCSHLVWSQILLMCKIIPVVQKLICCLKWMVKKSAKDKYMLVFVWVYLE